jgi:hypothetical protein
MLPVTAGFIATVPVPVGLMVVLALFPLNATFPVADKIVNVADAGFIAPIITLLILPVTAGFTVSVPVPVGLMVMLALAGLKFTVDNAVSPLNVPDDGAVAPITTLLIAPVTVGFAVSELVTVKSVMLPLVLRVTVFVTALVVIEIPPAG